MKKIIFKSKFYFNNGRAWKYFSLLLLRQILYQHVSIFGRCICINASFIFQSCEVSKSTFAKTTYRRTPWRSHCIQKNADSSKMRRRFEKFGTRAATASAEDWWNMANHWYASPQRLSRLFSGPGHPARQIQHLQEFRNEIGRRKFACDVVLHHSIRAFQQG